MKKVLYTLAFVLSTGLTLHASAQDDAPIVADSVDLARLEVLMHTFDLSISDRLSSENDLHRRSALREIIRDGAAQKYAREDVLNVVRIYRDHRDHNMRRMAVVALGAMNDGWAMDFLARSAPHEKTPQVLHTLVSVLDQHAAPATDGTDAPAIARGND